MRVRRCKVLYLEPREEVEFDLAGLLQGGDGLRSEVRWVALAPHLAREVELDASQRDLLGQLSAERWVDAKDLGKGAARPLSRLLREGLVLASGGRHAVHREREEAFRAVHWHPLAATLHAFTRWEGADAVQSMEDTGTATAQGLREVLGAPPPEVIERGEDENLLALPRSPANGFDALLGRRATCRNFDASRPLPLALFAQLVERVFAAQAQIDVTDDTAFLKKTSPSGGGLHPVETYLLVQNVEGLAPGLYHYRPLQHSLEPLPAPQMELAELASQAVARQHWFANAHAMAILTRAGIAITGNTGGTRRATAPWRWKRGTCLRRCTWRPPKPGWRPTSPPRSTRCRWSARWAWTHCATASSPCAASAGAATRWRRWNSIRSERSGRCNAALPAERGVPDGRHPATAYFRTSCVCACSAAPIPSMPSAPVGTVMLEPFRSSPIGWARPPRHLARKFSVIALKALLFSGRAKPWPSSGNST